MIHLKIEGMTCEHCVKAVRDALSAVPGVDHVDEINLKPGEAMVSGEPSLETLLAAIREEGYEARVA